MFSFFGVISIVANTVIVPYLVKRVDEKRMSIAAALLMGGGQVLMAVANSLNLFGAALAIIAVSSSGKPSRALELPGGCLSGGARSLTTLLLLQFLICGRLMGLLLLRYL